MERIYVEVFATTLADGGFSGYNAVDSRYGVVGGQRKGEALEQYRRACDAVREQ